MNILFKRSELENGSVINFNFHNNSARKPHPSGWGGIAASLFSG